MKDQIELSHAVEPCCEGWSERASFIPDESISVAVLGMRSFSSANPGACMEQETSKFISHIGIREMSDHFRMHSTFECHDSTAAT